MSRPRAKKLFHCSLLFNRTTSLLRGPKCSASWKKSAVEEESTGVEETETGEACTQTHAPSKKCVAASIAQSCHSDTRRCRRHLGEIQIDKRTHLAPSRHHTCSTAQKSCSHRHHRRCSRPTQGLSVRRVVSGGEQRSFDSS